MSTYKVNTSIPDTLRTFERNSDKYKVTDTLFITPSDFVFTPEEFEDNDFWYDNLGVNLFPLHGVAAFNSEDEKNQITQSKQDFGYKTTNGKYKHRYNFDWSLDYHKLINEISGQKVNVIFVSRRVLRATEKTDGNIKGFTVDLFDLEKIMFDNGSNNGNSELYIELFDSDELNVNGYECEVDWTPQKLDRLVLNISLSFGEDSITMLIKHLSNKITGIKSSDITITDDKNGDITFSTFIPGDGVYLLSGFSDTITTACLYIQSTLYIGAKRFTFVYRVVVINNMLLADGNNMVLANGENVVLAKN